MTNQIEYITNTTHLELTDLTPHTSYVFTVAASTSVGIGPYSTGYNIITPEDGKYTIYLKYA